MDGKKTWPAAALASGLAMLALAGCASVPPDAGLAELRAKVEASGQRLDWSPGEAIEPPSDDHLLPRLEGELTAERAVAVALANNRGLRATLEELGVARADLVEASTVRNPVLDGELRFPGDPKKPFEVGIMQTLTDLFQLRHRRALGQAAFEAERLRATGAVLGFAARVRSDYYTLQASQQALAQQRTIHDAAEAAAELARRQHDAGAVSDLDLEAERALSDQARLDLARAELDEVRNRERLLADLGALRGLPLTLAAQEPPPEGAQEPTQDEVEAALPGRLDLELARAELEAARRALPLSRASAYGDLAAGVHREREPEGDATTGPAVSVPIPLFDRGRAGRDRAVARLRTAEQRLYALTARAGSEARTARERLLEARQRAETLSTVVVPRRQRILELALLEYNAMLRGAYDLLRARQDLSAALREQGIANRDYWLARTELEAAIAGVTGGVDDHE